MNTWLFVFPTKAKTLVNTLSRSFVYHREPWDRSSRLQDHNVILFLTGQPIFYFIQALGRFSEKLPEQKYANYIVNLLFNLSTSVIGYGRECILIMHGREQISPSLLLNHLWPWSKVLLKLPMPIGPIE